MLLLSSTNPNSSNPKVKKLKYGDFGGIIG